MSLTRAQADQALESLATLAGYLDRTFPDAPGETVVGQAIWLLEHLHRIETMLPPALLTLQTARHTTLIRKETKADQLSHDAVFRHTPPDRSERQGFSDPSRAH